MPGASLPPNLYVHFPFCRRKCAYCALHSSAGSTPAMRAAHVSKALAAVKGRLSPSGAPCFKTVYFGGGTPALCDLRPFRGLFPEDAEFTVELHPLDVTDEKLDELKSIGVGRISLGVQSFCDATLVSMERLHSSADAVRAFQKIRAAGFANAGIDLIAGWPGDRGSLDSAKRAVDLGAVHVSVYTLIVEPGTRLARRVRGAEVSIPSDDEALDAVAAMREQLAAAGIVRYEISNYAKPGFECRHNLAVWRGEDYFGIGPGAYSREGRKRWHVADGWKLAGETVLDAMHDARERALFALRLAEGLDFEHAARLFNPSADEAAERQKETAEWQAVLDAWRARLDGFVPQGLVRQLLSSRYALTDRGFEVCDAVSAELIGGK